MNQHPTTPRYSLVPLQGVFVVHNKIKDKKGSLPADVLESRYFK